jgi:lysozyme family protein
MNRFSVIRIANVETDSTNVSTAMPALRKNLFKAFTLLPKQFKARARIYAPGAVVAALNEYYAGLVQPVTYEGAIPVNAIGDVRFDRFIIRQCDSMLSTEDVVG